MGGCNISAQMNKVICRAVRQVARISYGSFRKIAPNVVDFYPTKGAAPSHSLSYAYVCICLSTAILEALKRSLPCAEKCPTTKKCLTMIPATFQARFWRKCPGWAKPTCAITLSGRKAHLKIQISKSMNLLWRIKPCKNFYLGSIDPLCLLQLRAS